MKNLAKIISVFVFFGLLSSQTINAQVNYTTSFDGCFSSSCGDWTITGGIGPSITSSSGTGYSPCNTSSAKSNIWSSNPTTILTSGLLGVSNGTAVTFSFSGKAINYSTGAATTAGYCTFSGYWSTDGSAWTAINSVNNVSSTSCNTYTFSSFTPDCADNVYVRIVATRNDGDFYAVMDDISIVQNVDGPTGTMSRTCSGDFTSYDVEVTVSDLDGSAGVDISIGATTYHSNAGLGIYSITGLSGQSVVVVEDVANPCRGFTQTFEECDICIESPSLPTDECADAPLIDLAQAFTGSTDCAYTVSSGSPSVCGQSIDNDSWMRFIAGSTDVEIDFTVGTCTPQNRGIQLAVFSGTCGSLSLVAGSCDGPGSYGDNAESTSTWTFSGMTIGDTYYIRIDGYAGDLCDYYFEPVSGVVITPDNDECADALVLTCGDSDIASNILATDTDAPTACSGGGTPTKGVWYQFTGTGQEVTISTDNPGTNFDTQINIFTGTCGSLVCVGGDDDSGTGTTSSYTFTAANGTEYLIYVDGDGAAEGQFEISISCADVCIANPGTWQY
jgi:hypothetical protein